ncbi:MAG: TM0106 family RecB-like putative nuclease, partial [Ilumatobacteraceae bacterium]
MQLSRDQIILSPTDLANHLACRHLSWLNYHALHGGPKPSKSEDELADILRQYGEEHEQKYLKELTDKVAELGQGVIDLDAERDDANPYAIETLRDRAQQTKAALAAGGNVLYQPTFFREDDNGIAWVGRADFLVPVESLTFEPEDTKLARIAKVNAILQLCSYAEHLGKIQNKDPEYIHVVTGSVEEGKVSVRLDEVSAYYRRIKTDLEHAVLEGFTGPSEPIPVDFCTICRWNKDCNRTWREMDHLSFVAGLTNAHRETLVEAGLNTLAALATSSDDLVVEDLETDTLRKLQAQARLQFDARTRKETDPNALPGYEFLLPTREWRGFNLLPEPNPGDLFYDIEGHPYRGDEGLEYLHGFAWKNDDGTTEYKAIWAHSPHDERAALIELVEFISNRRKQPGFENMRVYHFGHYEPTTLTRLAARHGACETELAALLRERVFVDLQKVVTQSMRIGVESYSIKKLEQLYNFNRTDLVADGGLSIVYYERWLQSVDTEEFGSQGDVSVLDELAEYNENDCLSTIALRAWLEERRAEVAPTIASDPNHGFLVRPLLNPNITPDADSKGELIDALNLHRFEIDLTEETIAENTHRWLMADLLEFHKREKAVDNYEWVAALTMEEQQFIDDTKAIGGLDLVTDHGSEPASARSKFAHKTTRTYSFDPSQSTELTAGSSLVSPTFYPYRDDPAETGPIATATVTSIDLEVGTLEVEISSHDSPAPPITSGFGTKFINKKAFETALEAIGQSVVSNSTTVAPAARDMLKLRPPRFRDNFDLQSVSSQSSPSPQQIAEAIDHLDCSYLVVQGPPGTGKTYSSYQMRALFGINT